MIALGEVGLAGELRSVGGIDRRLGEAARLGFRRAVVPMSDVGVDASLEVIGAANLSEALRRLDMGRGSVRSVA